MMPTVDELMAAPRSTVVEPSTWPGRTPIWQLYHYEHGRQAGWSLAVHKDLHAWLRDLEGAGSLLGFGWEIRGEDAPDDWPGWPPDDTEAGPLDAAAEAAARRLIDRASDERDGGDRG